MSLKNSIVFFVVFGLLASLHATDANITKIGEWGTGMYEDVFIKGKYAYIAAGGSGLDIVDIGDPSNPTITGNRQLNTTAHSVHVDGNYAYVACDNGLHIIDVSNPASPQTTGHYSLSDFEDPYFGFAGNAHGVIVDGNIAYLAVIYGKYSSCRIVILDVADPANPQDTGGYINGGDDYSNYAEVHMQKNGNYMYYYNSLEYSLEVVDVSSSTAPVKVNSIYGISDFAVNGDYAYCITEGKLEVLDIKDPGNPKEPGSTAFNGQVKEMFASGKYLYLAEEVSYWASKIHVFDVSDPSAPGALGSLSFPGVPMELTVSGGKAYAAASAEGLFVFDISNPASPGLLKQFDMSWAPADMVVTGNRAYVADHSNELKIFDISVPASPKELGNYTAASLIRAVAMSGDHLYLATYKNGLVVADVKDPANPVNVGNYWPGSPGDCDMRAVAVSGNHGYVIKYGTYRNTLYVLDLENPASPREIASLSDIRGDKLHIHGNYLYIFGSYGVALVDISTPASPTEAGNLYNSYEQTPHVFVQGGFVHVAVLGIPSSIDIFEADKPAAVRVGQYNLNGYILGIFVKENNAYVLTDKGVDVVDVSEPRASVLKGHFDVSTRDGAIRADGNYIYAAVTDSGKLMILKFNDGDVPAQLQVNRKSLRFRADAHGNISAPQTISIDTPGDDRLAWSVSTYGWNAEIEADWIQCSQTAGTGSTTITVSIDPSIVEELLQNKYTAAASGTISISAPNALNSPAWVSVSISTAEDDIPTTLPFGQFSTPGDNTVVSGSIPVTGWALDDIGVESVKIYREIAGGNLSLIGDAIFVEGARPDVEMLYGYSYPNSYKAGWGYMLLTYGLPEGDGPLTLHVIATDIEGNRVTLGTRTVTVDNANSEDPFGAIDTPAQGGTISGAYFVNYGWALTPLPKTIPTDGSTIFVWIDGVKVGQPVYNQYRQDLAELFPGYNNTGGAMGSFVMDPSKYSNGLHTIAWSVEDDAGAAGGIGSRYFQVFNSAAGGAAGTAAQGGERVFKDAAELENMETAPMFLSFKTGFGEETPSHNVYPHETETDTARIVIDELERVAVSPEEGTGRLVGGYLLVNGTLRPLPVGSTLEPEIGTFSWLPGPGFVGPYRFVFIIEEGDGTRYKKQMDIVIEPRN